jgi:hypothetical protein
MRFKLKGVDVAGDYLVDCYPENIEFFELWVTALIGPDDEDGGTLYNVHVCTPDWLKYAMKYNSNGECIWGRHMLIINEFSPEKIERAIKDKIEDVIRLFPSDNSIELSEKIARYAEWEFEDYQP